MSVWRSVVIGSMLVATVMATAQPCAAQGTTAVMGMACCKDKPAIAPNCCVVSEQHHQQSQPERIVSITLTLITIATPVAPLPQELERTKSVSPASRAAPLHLLFSVFLV